MQQKKTAGLLAAFIAFAFALRYDRQIILFFQTHRILPLDIFFTAITHLGTMIAVLILIASLFMWKKNRGWIMPLWVSVGLAVLLAYIIKYAVMRQRPEAIGIAVLIGAAGYSFPSAHASTAFAALPVMDKVFKKLNYAWILLACLIALSRLYLGVHYLSDILFGAIAGYCSGWLFVELKGKNWFKKLNFIER